MASDETAVTAPTRVGLYESFLEEFLRKWEKRRPGERQFIVWCLQELAIEMRKSPRDRTYLADRRVKDALRRCLPTAGAQDIKDQLDDLYHLGLIEKLDGGARFFQETFQEYLCAKWLVDRGALPRHFEQRDDSTWFRDVQIDDVIRSFYDEIAGITNP